MTSRRPRSLEVAGVSHGAAPIPMGARGGNTLYSSGIPGVDPKAARLRTRLRLCHPAPDEGPLEVPMLPVLLNTYFRPNTPTAARCHEVARKIAAVLETLSSQTRIAVVASSGLSHFLCEEAFDREVVAALQNHDAPALRAIPQRALLSGSSEIRNWIMVGGMVEGLRSDFTEYIPVYRTPVGTGIGLAFMSWR